MRPFNQITGTAAITKQINTLYASGKKWDNAVQDVALSIVKHINEHHEVSLLNLHVEKMPKGARSNALRQWYVNHAKATYNEETALFEPSRGDAKDFTAAQEEHWTECKPEPTFKPIDLQAQIDALFARAVKAAASEQADLHKINPDTLASLSKLATVK